MAWACRRDIRERRAASPAAVALVLFVVVIGLFAASKFSNRGAQRPRYLMPVYTSVAVALGWGLARLAARSRPAAVVAGTVVLGANLAGLVPWLQGRAGAEARDRALLSELDRLGVRTGYAGFWVAPKYTFLSEGRVDALRGARARRVLGPRRPCGAGPRGGSRRARRRGRGAGRCARGPARPPSACSFRRTKVSGLAIFHDLGPPISLEDVAGYDLTGVPTGPGRFSRARPVDHSSVVIYAGNGGVCYLTRKIPLT